VLHSRETEYFVSGEQSATNEQCWNRDKRGMAAATEDLGPKEPKNRNQKQTEHFSVTEQEA